MDNTATTFLAISLIIIMTGMGLSLTLADFQRVLKSPKAVLIGFLNQIVLLPLLAFALIQFFKVDATLAMGVLILSACPGGPTSNLLSHLAKADTALSVTLTAVNSVVTIITLPLIVNFGLQEFFPDSAEISAPIGSIIGSLVAVIAVPLTIGMLINHYRKEVAAKMDRPVRMASVAILVIIIVGLVLKEKETILQHVADSIVIILSLNVLTMLVGFLSAKLSGLSFKQALTITLESGNQNGTLAITVAVGSLGQVDFAIAGAVYSLIMYFTAAFPIWVGIRADKKLNHLE